MAARPQRRAGRPGRTVTAQAVDHHRQQAAAHPDTATPALAGALNNLSVRLVALGRPEEALTAIDEAISLYRPLAAAEEAADLCRRLSAADPGTFIARLAGSLNNRSNALAALGRPQDALAAADEAVTLYRRLAVAPARLNLLTPARSTSSVSDTPPEFREW